VRPRLQQRDDEALGAVQVQRLAGRVARARAVAREHEHVVLAARGQLVQRGEEGLLDDLVRAQ